MFMAISYNPYKRLWKKPQIKRQSVRFAAALCQAVDEALGELPPV